MPRAAFYAALIASIVSAGCQRPIRPGTPASPTAPAAPGTSARSGPSGPNRDSAVASLRRDIDTVLDAPAFDHTSWGVLVKSLDSGDTIYARNERRLMIPASNMKIVTLAAAAERLGWDYRYETQLFTAGRIDDGILRGDLVVVGSGDPSIMAADGAAMFAEWAGALKVAGIHVVQGRVVGDDNAFEDSGLGFGWSWDDVPEEYSAGVGALQFNENAVGVVVAPGPAAGDSAGVAIEPTGSGLVVVCNVATVAAGAATSIAVRRLPGSTRLELHGTIAAGAPPATLAVSVDNPTLFFASALRDALIAAGIDVRGAAADVDDVRDPLARNPTPIATHRSAPLSTLAMRLMKASQNLYAETLLKTLALRAGAPVATADEGRRQVAAVMESWGIRGDSLIQRDGSGLSRYDYVTAEALVATLAHVDGDRSRRDAFEASLPIAGRDGSLANRMRGTAADNNARAKTGSMSQVRSLSGFVSGRAGEPLAFAIIANNFDVPAAAVSRAEDAIVVRLADFAR